MDWIDEKFLEIRNWIHNMSLKRALAAYILVLILSTFLLSFVTMGLCEQWSQLIWRQYEDQTVISQSGNLQMTYDSSILSDGHRGMLTAISIVQIWCPYVYAVISMILVSALFYRKRLNRPIQILLHGIEEIKKENLDISINYDSKDEMGMVCASFEEMRKELVRGKQQMWHLVEEQKKLNAAFAHDLRTPLTVLRGYSDFLRRYMPEGKVSQEKLDDTLDVMSGYIGRLEHYTNTMKELHSLDDRKVMKDKVDILDVQEEMMQITKMLGQIGLVKISWKEVLTESEHLQLDKWIVMEVFENLLSNAMRYARHQVWVSIKSENGTLYLHVEDDGKGFSKEDLKLASEPYYSNDKNGSDKLEDEHFGIGLHICTCLCKKHGGDMSIANRMDGGAIAAASFEL